MAYSKLDKQQRVMGHKGKIICVPFSVSWVPVARTCDSIAAALIAAGRRRHSHSTLCYEMRHLLQQSCVLQQNLLPVQRLRRAMALAAAPAAEREAQQLLQRCLRLLVAATVGV